MNLRNSLLFSISVLFLLVSLSVKASPFIGMNDKQLHQDLQILAEWGYLDATVTTFPVPWKGVAQQLERLEISNMTYMPAQSAMRLRHYLRQAKTQKHKSFLNIQANTETPRIIALDGPSYHQAAVTLTHQSLLDQWYIQGSITVDDDGDVNLDNSLIAYQFEEWQIRVGAIDQYWGPSQSSSLILSNNARPIPSIGVARTSTEVSQNKWLRWLGHWHYTGQFAQLESDRVVPNAKLMLNRFTFSPLSRLEIGASWAVMWGGDGQPEGFDAFWNVITFKKTCLKPSGDCTEAEVTKQGNHLAGFDFKYSIDLFNRPLTLYAQRIGEDAVNNIQITDNANLIGLSTYFGNAKVFLETSDTQIACESADATITDCYYEHGTYQTGYRHRGRAIGSTFDSDARQVTLGTNYRFESGAIAEVLLRVAELNPDGTRPSPVLDGALSEDLVQISGFYQTTLGDWLIKAGGTVENRDLNNNDSESNVSLYFNTVYSF